MEYIRARREEMKRLRKSRSLLLRFLVFTQVLLVLGCVQESRELSAQQQAERQRLIDRETAQEAQQRRYAIAMETAREAQRREIQETRPSMAEEISLVKAGGVYTLPVEINGVLTLKFVLDSGAAEVNIPADVVFTLLRSGTIKDTDFLPGKTYVLADGSELRSPRLIIRSLKIGRRQITNVPASVGDLSSPLLLGQSLLEKLGTWGIDNQRMVLLIQSEPSSPRVAAVPSASVPPPLAAGGNVAEQFYRRALKDYQERNYEAAVVNFKQFLRQAPRGHPQAGTAQYLIGESLYAQRQYEAAIVAFDEVVQKHSNDPKVPAALLKIGYAFAELRDPRNARFFLYEVQKKFPNSPEAPMATEKVRLLR